MNDIAARLADVRAQVARAAVRAGRDPDAVRVVAVSKLHPPGAVAAACRAGAAILGENYAQELVAKQDALAGDPACAAAEWHFIGRLQRNKVKQVVGRAALIHAVDSIDLAGEIDRRAALRGLRQAVLIAVGVAGEAHKSGVAPEDAAALIAAARALPALHVRGLMTMPPWPDAPEDSRRHFRALRELRDRLGGDLPELSMGTTGDLEVAVEEGATLVRVGTAVFGPRS